MANALPPIRSGPICEPHSDALGHRNSIDPSLRLFSPADHDRPQDLLTPLRGRVQRLDTSSLYKADVEYRLKGQGDPLYRALLLIREYKKNKDKQPHIRSTIRSLIKFICDPALCERDTCGLIPKEGLPFAKQALDRFCPHRASFHLLTGLTKWIFHQALIVIKQIQVMNLTSDAIDSVVRLSHLKKITVFFASIPKDLTLSDMEQIVSVVEVQKLVLKNLNALLFKDGPVNPALSEEKEITYRLDAMIAILERARVRAQISSDDESSAPFTTLPVISTPGSTRPESDEDAAKLEKALKQLKNEKKPMPFRLMALSRFIYYWRSSVDSDLIPTLLLRKLDFGIGKALYPNDPNQDPLIFEQVGEACRDQIAAHKVFCIHGAIFSVYQEIKSYVQRASQTILDMQDRKKKKVEGFHFLHSFGQLLHGLLDLKEELFSGELSQPGEILNEALQLVIDGLTDIVEASLRKEIDFYCKKWNRLIGLDPNTSFEDPVKAATYAINFHKYFFLDRLITTCETSKTTEPNDLIVKMLTHFSKKDRSYLLQDLCDFPPDTLWKHARTIPETRKFLHYKADVIQERALHLVDDLHDLFV